MFHFKQFDIEDEGCTMKVGTDAVVLGVLASPKKTPTKILDIGTGCGIIAMMMAQRFNCTVTGIDIDKASVECALNNIANSRFHHQITCIQERVQDFHEDGYDLIVSNPPYFVNSLKTPKEQRNLARHTDTLSFHDLLHHSARLMSPDGEFWVIIPAQEASEIQSIAEVFGLFAYMKIDIHNTPSATAKRTIFAFSKSKGPIAFHEYSIREEDKTYSNWYRTITEPFYTHLK